MPELKKTRQEVKAQATPVSRVLDLPSALAEGIQSESYVQNYEGPPNTLLHAIRSFFIPQYGEEWYAYDLEAEVDTPERGYEQRTGITRETKERSAKRDRVNLSVGKCCGESEGYVRVAPRAEVEEIIAASVDEHLDEQKISVPTGGQGKNEPDSE